MLRKNAPKSWSRRFRHDLIDVLVCVGLAFLFVLLSSGAAFSQGNVGINNPTPHAKSLLDLTSSDKGLLTPRMTAAQRTTMFPVADATAKGMLVYQTDGSQGFYYYDGASWIFMDPTSSAPGWGTLGNSGTIPATNFLGTTDNQPLVVRTNNAERMRVAANGNLGIGTNAPAYPLDLSATQSIGRFTTTNQFNGAVLELRNTTAGVNLLGAVNFNDAAGTYPGQLSYHPTNGMVMRSGGFERMRVQPDGTIGMGTSAPNCALDIAAPQATERITTTNAVNGAVLELKNITAGPTLLGAVNFNDAANTFPGQIAYLPASGMTFRSGGSERIRIATNGYVGIGTTAPAWKLDIQDPVYGARITSTNSSSGAILNLRNTTVGLPLLGQITFNDAAVAPQGGISYATTDGMVFRTGGVTERMRILPNGFVGIGTPAPLDALHVAGSIRMVDGTQGAGKVLTSDASGKATWAFPSGGSGWGLTGNAGTDPAMNFLGTTGPQDLALRTANIERMRLTTTGRLGIGTAAPTSQLHLQNPIASMNLTSTTAGSGSLIYLQNTAAAGGILGQVNFVDNTSTVKSSMYHNTNYGLIFSVNTITGVVIDYSGNVGVKTFFPGAELEVNGFTKLATDAPAVKMKKLTGSTSASQGGSMSIPHGLADATKIIALDVHVLNGAVSVSDDYTVVSGSQFQYQITATDILITNVTGNSGSILNKPVRILITYEQ